MTPRLSLLAAAALASMLNPAAMVAQEIDCGDVDRTGAAPPYLEDARDRAFYFNDPHKDAGIGVMRLIVFDSARSNPFTYNPFKD